MCNPAAYAALAVSIISMAGSMAMHRSSQRAAERAAEQAAMDRNRAIEGQFQYDLRMWRHQQEVNRRAHEQQVADAAMAGAYQARQYGREVEIYDQQVGYANAMRKNAEDAYGADIDLLNTQSDQINKGTDLEQFERKRQQERDRAKIRVASGESGLSGVSIFKELAASMVNSSYDISIMETNRNNQMDQQDAKALKLKADRDGRIAGAMYPIGPVAPMGIPNILPPLGAPRPERPPLVGVNY